MTLNILVIEDDPQISDALARLLSESGHQVTTAAGGAAGLRLWREQGAGLVLTDIRMPGMSGIDVILQLRAEAPRLPVIVMSGGDRSGDRDLLGMVGLLGAVAVLPKPFTMDELDAAIAAALRRSRRRPA